MKVTVLEDGVRAALEFPGPVVKIGRAIDNDIRLSGTLVSRHHCRIESVDGGAWVMDLGSSNGTQVNGERIKRRLLEPGDRVRVGSAELHVELPPAAAPPFDELASAGETQFIPGTRAPASVPGELGYATLTGDAQGELDNLRVFARITRELLRETDLVRLLRLIVDSAVGLVGGERGFLLLSDAGAAGLEGPDPAVGGMHVSVARSFDHQDIPLPASRLSMGIARRVAQSHQPLLSVDAGRDGRFDGMASVEDLRLRSVVCLPLHVSTERGKRIDGVLYIDNRLQQSAFSHEDLELLSLLADQAALAIRNARQMAEMRDQAERVVQSARKIELLNEQLGRKVRDRDSELAVVRAELHRERGRYDYSAMVGASEPMRRIFQQLDRFIESELPVLIEGESGTGKELIARAVHFNGARKDKPFVSENCAALPDTLLESELFGHARGAFTGAHRSKKGLLEQADGGTLFLDEIGDMSPQMQKKLLRVLQEGEFRSLGSDQQIKVDVRIIAASHRELASMVAEGTFREDLYYRVHVLALRLPPLRDRREDIPLLAEALLARAAREANRPVPHLPHEVLAALIAHDWPGNVRELENEMRRLVVLARDEVRLDLLSPAVFQRRGEPLHPGGGFPPAAEPSGNIRDAVADLERRSIDAALQAAGSNKSRAAQILGISRFALQRKLDKYDLSGRAGEVEPVEEGPRLEPSPQERRDGADPG